MIKAVLFDYGGVMTDGGRGIEITERIAANLGVSPERALALLDIGWTLYANGTISEDEFWVQLETAYGQPVPLAKRNIWNSWEIMQPKPEMVAFVQKLKASGLPVGLLSNVIPYTLDQLRSHGVYDNFDFTILSAEAGCGKPDPEFYKLALARLPGTLPEEVVFIDDQPAFLLPAQQLGIQTIHAQSAGQIIADTSQLIESSK